MYLIKITLIFVLIFSSTILSYETIKRNDETREIEIGNSIILHCKSNDDYHNFMFWHSTKGEIIGPRNKFNNNKFKYEVLSGNLTIKTVSAKEAGTYSCISDGVDKRDISVHSVNLIVKENGEEIITNERGATPQGNKNTGYLWKVSAILGSIFVFLVIVFVGLHIYHKETEKQKYFDILNQNEDDEDSTEELFTREPSTSGLKSMSDKDDVSDNFEKVYTAINVNDTTKL